jgi:hypothetical protein
VKFRKGDQLKTMHRLDTQLVALDKDPEANKEAIKAREEQLLPVYLQVLSLSVALYTPSHSRELEEASFHRLNKKPARPLRVMNTSH